MLGCGVISTSCSRVGAYSRGAIQGFPAIEEQTKYNRISR